MVGSPIPPGVRIGKLLQGEYLIKGILGEGELGVTYEAENARLRRKFAVLMLKRELKPTQGMMLQVRDDLRHAEPLMNAGIMPVKMIVDHMMIPGFATELLEGETLRARLSRGPLPPPRALATVLAVAKAMDALHKAGAVHGDLRPENIFLVRPGAKSAFAGRVMVVEHALHALRRRSQGLDDQLPLYKLMYRPPECLAGESGPHVGGDVFVLGAILHECLTGRPAFYDEVADFVIDNLNQPPKPVAPNPAIGLTAELASTLSVLVASACARDPQMRTPDMAEIIVAIEQVVQGAGLTLPTVVTEEPQAAPPTPPTPTASRMNRLLNRLSGVFPQVPLPPVADTAKSPPGTAAAAAGAGSAQRNTAPPGSGAPVPVAPQAITLPPLAAPRTKVTRLLQKLSGVFPVLQVSPDGNLETRQSSQPKLAGIGAASSPAGQSSAAAAPPPAAAPPEVRPSEPAPPSAVPLTSAAAPVSGRTEAVAPQSAQPTLVLSEKTARPVTQPPLLKDQPTPQVQKGPQALESPVAPAAEPRPAMVETATQPLLTDKPAADSAAARTKTAPPLSPASQTPAASPSAKSPIADAARPAAAEAAPPASTASPVAGTAEPSQSVKSSEVAKALALLRQQQQARAAGVPFDPARAGAGPATPGFVVPSFMAPPAPAAPAGGTPAMGVAVIAAKGPETPSASSPHPAAPPVAATSSPAHPPIAEPPAATVTAVAAGPQGAAPGAAAEAVTPAISLPPSAFSPTGERPPTAPASPPTIAFDSTLQPNDLADFVEAAKSLVDSRQGPTTLSEIPTRPAAMAGVEPIPQHMEAKTQPALRRLPITEQATQAKLPTDLFALADSLKAPPRDPAAPDPAAPASVPLASAPAADTAPVVLPASAAVPGPAPPAAPPFSAPPVPRDSIVELDPANLGADLPPLTPAAPPPPPPERPARPRPPRVSQLIKALQQGQIDPLQAMQQASGSPREAAPAGPRATGANPLATGGQPIGPASAVGSGPAQGRISPGLMPMAPAPPKSPTPESPWGTGTQQVTPAPRPAAPAPLNPRLRSFILRNQELVAAVFGALLVMLLGIAFLLLR